MRIEMSGTEDADNLLFQAFKQRRGEILGKEKKKRAMTRAASQARHFMQLTVRAMPA